MATRIKADITERWWKQAWPEDGLNAEKFSDVTRALKAWKVAQRCTAPGVLLKSLDDLDAALKLSADKSKARLAKLDEKKAKLFTDDIATVQSAVAALRADAARVGDAVQTVYSRDISKELNSRLKDVADMDVHVGKTQVEFQLLVAVVNEIKAKGGDAFLNRGYNDLVDDSITAMEKRIRKEAGKFLTARRGEIDKIIGEVIQDELNSLMGICVSVPTDVLRRVGVYSEVEKTYAGRMAKKVGKATVSTVSAVAAGAAITLPGTLPLAIVGCCMASLAALRDIADVVMTLETKAAILQKYMNGVATNLQRKAGWAATQEGVTAVLNEIAGLDILPTLKKVKADFTDLEEGVQILMHRLTVKQKNALKASDAFAKMVREQDDFNKSMGEKLNRDQMKIMKMLDKATTKIGKELEKQVSAASDLMKRGLKIERHYNQLNRQLKSMNALGRKVETAQTVADVVGILKTVSLAIVGIGDAVLYDQCAKLAFEADRIAGVAVASVAGAKDLGLMYEGLCDA